MLEAVAVEVLEPEDLFSEIYPSYLCHSPETTENGLLGYMKDISPKSVVLLTSKRCYSSTVSGLTKKFIKVEEKNGELVTATTDADLIIISEDDPKERYRILQIAFATGKPIFFETVSREIVESGIVLPVESNINLLKHRDFIEVVHLSDSDNSVILPNLPLRIY